MYDSLQREGSDGRSPDSYVFRSKAFFLHLAVRPPVRDDVKPVLQRRRHLGVEAGCVDPVDAEGDEGLRGADDERAADVGHEL